MISSLFKTTLIAGTLAVLLFTPPVLAQQCPSDPRKIKSMISELRDTFECSGLNFKSCNEYRGLVIGGAAAGVVVGGAVAAKTAAGIALLKSKEISCPMPGSSAALPSMSSTAELFAILAFGEFAEAKFGAGCSISKKEATKIFDGLRRDAFEQSQRIAAEMKDRMLAEKLSATDLSKIAVTDGERQKAFSEGLDLLEKQIRSGSASVGAKESAIEAVNHARGEVASGSGSVASRISRAHERVMGFVSDEVRENLSAGTRAALSYWEHTDRIRAEKAAKLLGESSAKIAAQVQIDLDRIRGMGSNSAGRADALRSRGYKEEFITKLLSVDDARKMLNHTGSQYQGIVYDINSGMKYKNAATLALDEVRAITPRRVMPGYDIALRTFREMPGLNNSLGAAVRRIGAEAIAKTAGVAEGRLGTMVKYVAPVVTGVGKAMALPVQVAYEASTFSKDAHCGGEMESRYARKSMVTNEQEKESCRSNDLRTDKTDEFLYGLSPSEQLEEVRRNSASCDLLVRMYSRYAPSQNWKVTCDGTNATLNGKTTKGEGQMIRFNAASGTPQNVEWYSGSFESCAKVSMKDGAFESAQVFETKNGIRGCGTEGSGKTVRESNLYMRQDTSDEKQMVKQYADWQASNSFVMSAATDCCRSGDSGTNPMCSNVSKDRDGSDSNRPTRR